MNKHDGCGQPALQLTSRRPWLASSSALSIFRRPAATKPTDRPIVHAKGRLAARRAMAGGDWHCFCLFCKPEDVRLGLKAGFLNHCHCFVVGEFVEVEGDRR